MRSLSLSDLRRHAISQSLFGPMPLRRAIQRLGFVQADPIRSPARAQDLILRHRVQNYRAGDLESKYPALHLEEDFLYAYGFMPQSTWRLIHPRPEKSLSAAEQKVLDIVAAHKRIHPRELEAYLGRDRELNGWGGYSKATTRTLEALHYRGLLRISGRDNGIRLYERAANLHEPADTTERLRQLILLIATILSPLPDSSLRAALRLLGRSTPSLVGRQSAVATLLLSGDLAGAEVDGVRYVWPAGRIARTEPQDMVRFLAPFDPLVWDRRRFEHFWGWPYRFEAYTPPPKRKLGYYAMPMLWREDVVGWVNISYRKGQLNVEPGFVNRRPGESMFRNEFDAEVERFRLFIAGGDEPRIRSRKAPSPVARKSRVQE